MATSWKLIAISAAALAAAGCTPQSLANFNSPAGAQIDSGTFGNATMHNMLAQTCGTGKGGKLGGVRDPIVVLDPASTPHHPIYRVHCNRSLNGKYARVIWSEYLASAVPPPETGVAVEGAP